MMVNADITRNSSSGTTIPNEYGFVWTTNSFPPVSGLDAYPNKMSVPVQQDSYSATILGLDTNTQYYVKSYIKYLGKTKFSSSHTIKTLVNENQCVTINISNPINVTNTSATFHVTVTGNAPVTDKGICYSHNPIPTIEDFVVSDGSGTGDFTVILDSLQEATQYYVRPYAVSDERIFYGEIKIKTPCSQEYHYTSYRDANGTLFHTCVNRITTGGTQTLTSGWYSLSNEQQPFTTGMITINGNVHLILEDSCNWIINNGGVRVNSGNSLTIYAENKGTGKLTTTGRFGWAGIRVKDGDTLIINGGNIIATGGNGGAGIGGNMGGNTDPDCCWECYCPAEKCGTIIINGGIIKAKGGNAGDGGDGKCRDPLFPLEAIGGAGGYGAGAGIGGGGDGGGGGTITINGGTITAEGGSNGSGGSNSGAPAPFYCIVASGDGGSGGGKGAGIGGGGGRGRGGGTNGAFTNGTNGVPGNSNGAIIGSGSSGGGSGGDGGDGGTVIINGGSVNATGGTGGYMEITNSASQNIYLNTLTTDPEKNNAILTSGTINGIPLADVPSAANKVYGKKDVKTDATGKLYFYLPCSPNGSTQTINVTIDGVEYTTAPYPCEQNHNIEHNLTGE